MECHLFNITEIRRKNSSPLLLEFYGGDITNIYSDALLVSAFQSGYRPTSKSVFGRLNEKFGLDFSYGMPKGSEKISENLLYFHTQKTSAFCKLLVFEIKSLVDNDQSGSTVRRSFNYLENAVLKFEQYDIHSISLPMIGSGYQQISLTESATYIMRLVKKWAAINDSLNIVRVFAHDLEAASILNSVIDGYFGVFINYNNSSLELLNAATEELHHKKKNFDESLKKQLDELYEIASSDKPSIKSIAISGRVLAEESSKILYRAWNIGNDSRLSLNQAISEIQGKLLSEQPWILSYLRLLQSCGNNAAHSCTTTLSVMDACAVLISAIRIAEYVTNCDLGK